MERNIGHPRHEGTECEQFAMGEVGEAGGAIDQREADGPQGDQQSEAHTFDRELSDLSPLIGGFLGALAGKITVRLTDGDLTVV
jgi:hypothetical protein